MRSEGGHVICDITKEACPFWLQGAKFLAKITFVSFQQTSPLDWSGRHYLIGENLCMDFCIAPETLGTQKRHLL